MVDAQTAYDDAVKNGISGDDLKPYEDTLTEAEKTLSGMSEESDPLLVAAKKQYDAAKAKYDTIARQQEDIDYKLIPYRDALDAAYEEYDKRQHFRFSIGTGF